MYYYGDKEMKKTKFRILIYIPIFTLFLLLTSVFTLIIVSPYLNNNEPIVVKIVSVFALTIIPLVLFVYSYITMWPCVEFSEDGIEKTGLVWKLNSGLRYHMHRNQKRSSNHTKQ